MGIGNKMDFNILTRPSEVSYFIDTIQSLADSNKKALGFLPKTAFVDQANNGRLWVAVDTENKECLGYLMFGGRFPILKIFQLFVSKKNRKKNVGSTLLGKFKAYAEKNHFLSINARVAADLTSNRFWGKSGYALIGQVKGGKTTNRIINIRTKELDTPSLFKLMSFDSCVDQSGLKSLKTIHRPLFRSPTYVIDLNIFFDVVKNRLDHEHAARLISAGLNNEIKIYITPEFCTELERYKNQGDDPILEFAKQLPTLPNVSETEIQKLIDELKPIVFPERKNADEPFSQNRSDLIHLAYCIHHGASGFITREKAILSVGEQLKESYLIEVLSASDLSQPHTEKSINIRPMSVVCEKEKLAINSFNEEQRELIEKFLIAFRVNKEQLLEVLHPGTRSTPRSRIVACMGDKILGVASWDNSKSLSPHRILHLYVDENCSEAEMVVDHVLEASLRDTVLFFPMVVTLNIGPEQATTLSTALNRGFLPTHADTSRNNRKELVKFVFNGLISKNNWYNFRDKFHNFTDFNLPTQIPTISEFNNTGIIIKTQNGADSCLSLFDFETLVSPGIVLCPGRDAIIVPIRKKYAQNFFQLPHTQLDLFFSPMALFRIEKAYFRSYRNASIFDRGRLVLFYISGSGGGFKEVIGCGRITFSEVISVDKASLLLDRQGVLSRDELVAIANKDNLIHAFTFDNFSRFQNKISFALLKKYNLVSGANLVTPQCLSSKDFFRICEMGYSNGDKNHA